MSITFVFFQFPFDILTLIFIFIEVFVVISLNVMLLLSRKTEEGMRKENILISLSIINIVFTLLRFAVPSVVGLPSTDIEITIFRIYMLSTGLFARIPYFITYGLMMYWYGRVNRDSIHRTFMVSAWIFMVCTGFFVLDFTFAFIDTLTSSPYAFFDIQVMLRYIFIIVYFAGWINLTLYGKIARNIYFVFAGILGGIMVFFLFLSSTFYILRVF